MTNKEAYREFCKTAPDLPVFAQDWYLDAVCEGGEWDVALVKEDDKIVASMPYFLKQKWGLRYATMPLHTKHLGPYLLPIKRQSKKHNKYHRALMAQLPKTVHFLQDFSPQVTNWLNFYWAGYSQSVRYTYVLDLEDLEEVFNNFNRNIRRNIKKAEQKLSIDDAISLEEFYAINKMSFERQGIPIYFSYSNFQRMDRALAMANARKIFVARDSEQNIHAVSYLIWDKKRSYYHLAGEDPHYRGSGASILCTWAAIRFSKVELGLKTLDFEGSMLEPIEAIRRQFGAQQEQYFRVWKYNSILFQLLDGIRQLLP